MSLITGTEILRFLERACEVEAESAFENERCLGRPEAEGGVPYTDYAESAGAAAILREFSTKAKQNESLLKQTWPCQIHNEDKREDALIDAFHAIGEAMTRKQGKLGPTEAFVTMLETQEKQVSQSEFASRLLRGSELGDEEVAGKIQAERAGRMRGAHQIAREFISQL